MMISLILVLILVKFSFESCEPANCTNDGRCVTADLCGCYSGYYGDNCELETVCGDWKTADPLATDYVPEFMGTSGISSNQIHIHFESPVVTERNEYRLVVGGVSDNICDSWYGAGWSYGVDNCTVKNDGSLDWDEVEELCDWIPSHTADELVYSNTIFFSVLETFEFEYLDPISRSIEWDYNVIVRIPKTTLVDVIDIDVLAPVSLTPILYEQDVDKFAGNGLFKLFTRVQYPFVLTFNGITQEPAGFDTSFMSLSSQVCPIGSGNCDQHWTHDYTLGGGQCNVSGTYTYQYLLNCRAGYGTCPYENEIVEITTTIVSENFCDELQMETEISAVMESCEDAFCGTPDGGFTTDETSYYLVTVTSEEITLDESEIISVWLSGAANVNLYIDQVIIDPASNFTAFSHVDQPRFQFDLGILDPGVYTVHAKVGVTYTFETERRTVVEEQTTRMIVDPINVVVAATDDDVSNNSGHLTRIEAFLF